MEFIVFESSLKAISIAIESFKYRLAVGGLALNKLDKVNDNDCLIVIYFIYY